MYGTQICRYFKKYRGSKVGISCMGYMYVHSIRYIGADHTRIWRQVGLLPWESHWLVTDWTGRVMYTKPTSCRRKLRYQGCGTWTRTMPCTWSCHCTATIATKWKRNGKNLIIKHEYRTSFVVCIVYMTTEVLYSYPGTPWFGNSSFHRYIQISSDCVVYISCDSKLENTTHLKANAHSSRTHNYLVIPGKHANSTGSVYILKVQWSR